MINKNDAGINTIPNHWLVNNIVQDWQHLLMIQRKIFLTINLCHETFCFPYFTQEFHQVLGYDVKKFCFRPIHCCDLQEYHTQYSENKYVNWPFFINLFCLVVFHRVIGYMSNQTHAYNIEDFPLIATSSPGICHCEFPESPCTPNL